MQIYLIRHGETAGNRDRIVQLPETPLSPRGIEQADLLAERLSTHPIARIVSSDLARAAMTADALARGKALDVEYEPLLQERNFGDWRGHPYSELEVDLMGPNTVPPAGESWAVFHERVDRAWDRVRALAKTSGPLAVVSHGLVLYSVFSRHIGPPTAGEDPPDVVPMQFGNTALSILEGEERLRATLTGCTAHLDDGPTPRGISGL